ncbi:response regulator transcription factor [Poseidonocella sp. HB161398]|uniref:response regulator transcription factor n=1 Tax=Poseidonocella sp. HB161398 TaxID=2320855 RepID=UPI001108D8E2|nr:response regulator [Poseidonocella sp. HB161398]
MFANPLVAIVDDDASFRAALEGFLRSLGCRALGFASAEDFLQSGAPDRVGCVVSDIQMPGMSGIELARTLGARDRGAAVILVTALAGEQWPRAARESGAVCLLQKPFDPQELALCLSRAMGG